MGEATRADEELVGEFQRSGDPATAAELADRYVRRIRAIIRPIVLNDADADDLTQEAMLRALRGLHGFRGGARVSTWMHRIAVNTALSFLRRRPARAWELAADDPATEPVAGGHAPDRACLGRELGDEIDRAMAALPAHLRVAVTLTMIEGMTVPAAADVAGCLAATMYWRVHAARKRLKRQLGAYLES